MCLAAPVKIVELNGVNAIAEANGIRKNINVSLINDPAVGEHVLVHAGFALQKWSEQDVDEFNKIINEMASLDQQA
jgi:hydrogenase expression/formation protein HypC